MALLLGALTPCPRASAQGTFTRQEARRLAHGDLVTRPDAQREGQLILVGGTSWQVVDAPPEVVWRAFMDVERFPRFVPRVVEARVVERRSRGPLVWVHHQDGPVQAVYQLQVNADEEAHMAQFRIDTSRPHDVRAGWGFFTVRPYRDGKAMITFGVMADVGSGLLSGLLRPRVHEWMLRVPSELKKYVEGSGRERYAHR